MRSMNEGDEIDLGGRTLMAVEPVIRDLRTTWWGFDTKESVLFPGDGFAYSHYHEDGHCGLIAEEAVSLDLPDVSSTFADLALFWTKFADMNVYCDRLDHLIERLGVKVVAPTHGLPITDVKSTVPKVQEGLKAAALMPKSGTNEKVVAAGGLKLAGTSGLFQQRNSSRQMPSYFLGDIGYVRAAACAFGGRGGGGGE